MFIRTIQDAPVCDTSWSGFVRCTAPALFHVSEPVLLFSKLNEIFFGYFDQKINFRVVKLNNVQGDLGDISAKKLLWPEREVRLAAPVRSFEG